MGNYKGGCYLDAHPNANEIATWLRQGLTSTAINQNLHRLGDTKRHTQMAISAHRRLCLGLPKQLGGKPKQQAADIPEETPDPTEIRDLALRVFYHRLKTDPASVKTSELVPVLREFLRAEATEREKDKTTDPLDEAMNDLAAETA